MSIYTLLYNLGWAVGVVTLSPFMQLGYRPGFVVPGALCALAGGLCFLVLRARRPAPG